MVKKREASSLGEVTSGSYKGSAAGLLPGSYKGSAAGLLRLASEHPSVRHILGVIERLQARPYATNAVIGGEAGTGKEGLAHTLHELMHPEGGPIVSVSTAGRDEHEVAVELFGAVPRQRGERPFDGAAADADGGTLILDEVIGLSPALQRRLLDLVKKGRYRREGDLRERRTQLVVLAITDGNLAGEVVAGRFRHDLYHKLARLDLVLPPLRERPEDIPAAVQWMASRVLSDRGRAAKVGIEPSGSEPQLEPGTLVVKRAAIEALRAHPWQGNFRELEIVVERAVLLYGDGAQLTAADVGRALDDPRRVPAV